MQEEEAEPHLAGGVQGNLLAWQSPMDTTGGPMGSLSPNHAAGRSQCLEVPLYSGRTNTMEVD